MGTQTQAGQKALVWIEAPDEDGLAWFVSRMGASSRSEPGAPEPVAAGVARWLREIDFGEHPSRRRASNRPS